MGAWAKSKGTPYFLMGPGLLWLTIFFVLPMLFMLSVSLYQGSLDTTFEMTWHFENFKTAITDFDTQFVRSFIYAGAATLLCLVIAYPLSYAIAFKAGRWRQVMLLCVIAPFFTTYLIRTYAWQTILSNDGTVVNVFQTLGILGDDGTLLKTPTAVIAGLTYNFLPFMVLPIYASLEQMDTRLIEAGRDLYERADRVLQDHAADLDARGDRRNAPHVHPRGRRLRERDLPRQPQPGDDRQRDPEPVPGDQGLPDSRGHLLHHDGADRPHDRHLHQVRW